MDASISAGNDNAVRPSAAASPTRLRLSVNGIQRTVDSPDPRARLSSFLRDDLRLKSVRVCCGEGGCGSCTVLYSPPHYRSRRRGDDGVGDPPAVPVNACLRLLISCRGASVVTAEGLGSSRCGYHPIQSALAGGGGVQCGFCSPGLTLGALGYWLEYSDAGRLRGGGGGGGRRDGGVAGGPDRRGDGTDGGGAKAAEDSEDRVRVGLERYLDGHICRCTGYRPILSSLGDEIARRASRLRRLGGAGGRPPFGAGEDLDGLESKGGDAEFAPLRKWGINDIADVEDSHRPPRCVGPCPGGRGSTELPPPPPPPPAAASAAAAASSSSGRAPWDGGYYRPESVSDLESIYRALVGEKGLSPGGLRLVAANTASGIERYYCEDDPTKGEGREQLKTRTITIDINSIEELREYKLLRGNGDGDVQAIDIDIDHADPSLVAEKGVLALHVGEKGKVDDMPPHGDSQISWAGGGIEVGSMVTISSLSRLLNCYSKTAFTDSKSPPDDDETWQAASRHLDTIGNTQIRSVGTWGGNVMFSLRHAGFSSDVVLVLMGLNATLSYLNIITGETRDASVQEFMRMRVRVRMPRSEAIASKDPPSSILLLSLRVPRHAGLIRTSWVSRPRRAASASATALRSDEPAGDNPRLSSIVPGSFSRVTARRYKVAERAANARGHVSCYIAAGLSWPEGSHGRKPPARSHPECHSSIVVVSGLTESILRGTECARAMVHSTPTLREGTLGACIVGLDRDIDRAGGMLEGRHGVMASGEYRLSVARAFLYKFFMDVTGQGSPEDPCRRDRPVTSIQSFATQRGTYPISFPIPKLDGLLLASGEARYTIDHDLPSDGLFGAFIVSKQAAVPLLSIDASAAYEAGGVLDVITADDVPCRNSILPRTPRSEEDEERLFVEVGELVPCVGACLGVVLAKSEVQAQIGVRRVRVVYGGERGEAGGIFSLEAAMAARSTFNNCDVEPMVRGDVDDGLLKSEITLRGTVTAGGQKHFYLENQNAVATPMEGGCLTIRSATQSVTATQAVVSNVMGIAAHKVNVVMRRTGGAFGGKITRSIHCAAAAAIAAAKHGCPVHICNDRDTDFAMVGGREPIIFLYHVGFDLSGCLLALSLEIHMDSGCTKDESESDLGLALRCSDHAYFVPDFRSEGFLYRTNLPSNTACRAPASVQVCHAIDTILLRVSKATGIPMQRCQEINMYKKGQATLTGDVICCGTLERVWHSLLNEAKIMEKHQCISSFNSKQRWKKRGLGITPCKYGLVGSWFKEIAKVCIFASDGSCSVWHSGVEMGQGIDTKVVQAVSMSLGVPLDWISTGEKCSNAQPNTCGTFASATSEVCCDAVLKACIVLNERLAPFKNAIIAENSGEELFIHDLFLKSVQAADQARVCLSAEGWSAPVMEGFNQYHVYCAAAVEVELDLLTGAALIRSADITYDCGNQLNASIDIGQIEGGFVMGLGYF